MKSHRITTLLLLLSLLSLGCKNSPTVENSSIGLPVAIEPTVTDNPSEQRIDLLYANNTQVPLCYGPNGWPTSGGILNNDGTTVHLTIEGVRYYLEKEEDYCPKCESKLEAGGAIRGFLKYSAFGLEEKLWTKPKLLRFNPLFWQC